ncbi:MAG: translation initiation factor IF-2 [Deltaproteobacteria bacterium]|nr:translation initiation factor IF-2 [Deltaproteobacteria bacterium]
MAATVRAYKLAEELGIDRNDFVAKAKEAGVELRNAMAMLDDAQVALLREKLSAKKVDRVTEARVEVSGAAVIRRRKRTEPEPPPPAPEPVAVPAVAEPVAVELTPEVQPDAAEPSAEPAKDAEAEPIAAAPAPAGEEDEEEARQKAAAGRARTGARDEAAPAAEVQTRKQFREVVNLREQEMLAKQVVGRAAAPRTPVVDPRTLASPRKKRRDAPVKKSAIAAAAAKPGKRVVRVEGEISVADLAHQLGVKAPQIQGKLMGLGMMVSIQQTINAETAALVASEFGGEVQDTGFSESEYLDAPAEAGGEEKAGTPRPPVVTVMGHVDHGKTSLLDALRKANVVAGEAGGITQHIGAYQVETGGHTLTFIDTPGHAAFTSMRARGAQVTDIVILVVAASEGIMPQTIEAISHAKAADVPIIVAVNKCDLPDANPALTRQRLMEHGIVVEDFGGETLAVNISATKRTGLDKLLEAIVLQAELLEPRADASIRAKGVVLEAQLDKGLGPVATVLLQEGTLRRGDIMVVGTHYGRVRIMNDDKGEQIKEAGPSKPVQVIGLSGVPGAGDVMHVVESERVAKEIVDHRLDEERKEKAPAAKPKISLEDLFAGAGDGPKELALIVKADVQGSAEAISAALGKLSTEKVKVNVIHVAVGGVTESDVQLAQASRAIVVGFHVRPDAKARKAAEGSGVEIRTYQIIYELLDEVKAAMAGLLPPTTKEVVLGQAEVRQLFSIAKVGTIAGSYVTDGLIRRGATGRLVRDGVQVWQGKFSSLKRFKDDAREVQTGFECGIGLDGFNDLKVGDVVEAFEIESRPAEL